MTPCKECTKKFTPTRSWMIFCSDRCREAWYKKTYVSWKKYRAKQLTKARTKGAKP